MLIYRGVYHYTPHFKKSFRKRNWQESVGFASFQRSKELRKRDQEVRIHGLVYICFDGFQPTTLFVCKTLFVYQKLSANYLMWRLQKRVVLTWQTTISFSDPSTSWGPMAWVWSHQKQPWKPQRTLRISWDPPKKSGLDVYDAGFWISSSYQFWDPVILRGCIFGCLLWCPWYLVNWL